MNENLKTYKISGKRINFLAVLIGLLSFNLNAQPDWPVNTSSYNLDGSIVVSLKINEEFSTDTSDIIAAFDSEGNCRGKSYILLDVITNSYISYLTVLSSSYGDELTFKIYDASEDKVYLTNNESILFVSNLSIGDLFDPLLITSLEEESLSVNSYLQSEFLCYPNPVKETLFFNYPNDIHVKSIDLFDMNLKLIDRLKVDLNEVNLDRLETGIYFLKIETNLGVLVKKIVKQ